MYLTIKFCGVVTTFGDTQNFDRKGQKLMTMRLGLLDLPMSFTTVISFMDDSSMENCIV